MQNNLLVMTSHCCLLSFNRSLTLCHICFRLLFRNCKLLFHLQVIPLSRISAHYSHACFNFILEIIYSMVLDVFDLYLNNLMLNILFFFLLLVVHIFFSPIHGYILTSNLISFLYGSEYSTIYLSLLLW